MTRISDLFVSRGVARFGSTPKSTQALALLDDALTVSHLDETSCIQIWGKNQEKIADFELIEN